MNATSRTLTFAAFIAISGALAGGCVIVAGDEDSSLLVVNRSDFIIDVINVTDVGSSSWGPNLAPRAGLFPDEELYIALDCDTYDARLIDEDGVECTVYNLDLCFDDADWIIRNNTCSVWGAAKEAREAAEAAKAAPNPTELEKIEM